MYVKKRTQGVRFMEKVIRVCELTGRLITVADNLTTEEAIAIVKAKAKDDQFGCYYRIKK